MGVIEQDVLEALLHRRRVERFGAHVVVGVEGLDDRTGERVAEVGRVGELLLGVARGLLLERLRLEQLPHEHVVHVYELVLLGGLGAEELVEA